MEKGPNVRKGGTGRKRKRRHGEEEKTEGRRTEARRWRKVRK